MNAKYEIKLPVSIYIQVVSILITLSQLRLLLRMSNSTSALLVIILICTILLLLVAMFVLLKRIFRKSNELEITQDILKINHKELRIQEIEKIIIQGYFVESIGIKLYGRKYISIDYFFRFKHKEEVNIEEFKQWAIMNGIKVISGKIKIWI